MLEPLLGSKSAEYVLMFISARGQGYAREIARFYDSDPDSIQKQLVKLEFGGILVAEMQGRTKIYRFSQRYPFLAELRSLIDKAMTFYSADEQERLLITRKRPRWSGKPL